MNSKQTFVAAKAAQRELHHMHRNTLHQIDKLEVKIKKYRHWATELTVEDFRKENQVTVSVCSSVILSCIGLWLTKLLLDSLFFADEYLAAFIVCVMMFLVILSLAFYVWDQTPKCFAAIAQKLERQILELQGQQVAHRLEADSLAQHLAEAAEEIGAYQEIDNEEDELDDDYSSAEAFDECEEFDGLEEFDESDELYESDRLDEHNEFDEWEDFEEQ